MSTTKNNNKIESSYYNFNHNRQIQKNVSLLKGLMKGLVADKKLNTQEVLFLDLWLKSHTQLSSDDDKVLHLIEYVKEILQEQYISQNKLDKLSELIHHILHLNQQPDHNNEESLNVLQGIIQGILADDVLSDDEINSLDSWLKNHSELYIVWPASELIEQLKHIYEDGLIDEKERTNLMAMLTKIISMLFDETVTTSTPLSLSTS